MLQCHLAMAHLQSSAVIAQSDNHELAKVLPHVLGHPKMSCSQSLRVLTPKWSTQSGKTITSCSKIPGAINDNLHSCIHKVFSQPGGQSISTIETSEDISLPDDIAYTEVFTKSDKPSASYFNVILRWHICNLRR